MNGARSTYMRKGYLLTALAAAVLLAASSGTALAQPSVEIRPASGSVAEDATSSAGTPKLLEVTVHAMGLPSGDTRAAAVTELGGVTYEVAPTSGVVTVSPAGTLDFSEDDSVKLTITPVEDTNWRSESFSIDLEAAGDGIDTGRVFRGMVNDDEVAPIAKFERTSVTLIENTSAMVGVTLVEGKRGAGIPTDVDDTNFGDGLTFTASPAAAVAEMCGADGVLLSIDGAASYVAATGVFTTAAIEGLDDTPDELTLMACDEEDAYKDTTVTLTIDPKSLMNMTAGDITAGAPLKIMIQSDEPIPTLAFVPTDIAIPEGGSTRVTLAADGPRGTEVMMVKLSVEGDAMVSLMQAGEELMEDGGYVMVDLGDSANARLTVMSHSDPDLMDGEMKSKTWKLMEGGTDGADIDPDAGWLTVTVNGSTAVPALPLVGQLLLALFLMAGGARFYRRRQG